MCFLLLSVSLPPLTEDAPLPATCLGSPAGRRGEALRRDRRQMAERRGSTRQGQILEQIQRREFARRERVRGDGEGGGGRTTHLATRAGHNWAEYTCACAWAPGKRAPLIHPVST